MNPKTYLLLLLAVFFVSLLPRLISLGSYPPLLWDEAAIGYNAYSLLLTGRDEHGAAWPLVFKSFGDYKPGLYIYLTVPSVALFGLNAFAVRFPSALLGALTSVLLVHFLKKRGLPLLPSLLSGIILAFNPFNLHFSRGAWETNLLTFLLLLFVFLFSSHRYFLSAVIAGLSLYSYQAAKLITPLIILASLISFPPSFSFKNLFKFTFPLFLLGLPLAWGLLTTDSSRLKVVSLFSYPPTAAETDQIITEGGRLDYYLFHSRPLHFASQFLSRYFNHLSPEFIITSGDWANIRHSAPYFGLLLLPAFIFLPLGLFSRPKKLSALFTFFWLWLLFAPIPSALTRDSVSAVRSHSLSLPLVFFSTLGLAKLLGLKPGLLKNILVLGTFLSFTASSFLYFDSYYHHLVRVIPFDWIYGSRQAALAIISNQSMYRNLYYSDFYGQPYIYYLFYSAYPPSVYQQTNHLYQSGPDTGQVSQIDNLTFGPINFSQLQSQSSVYAVISYDEVVRQGIDPQLLTPLSPINNLSTYYVYHRP